jgi:tight adherence protein C
MILAVTALTFISVFVLLYILLIAYGPVAGPAQMRLRALNFLVRERTDIEAELAKPFSQRVLSPLSQGMAKKLARITPEAIRKLAEGKIMAAGGFGGLNPDQFLLLCGLSALGFPFMTWVFLKITAVPANKVFAFSMIAFSLGFYLPFLLINRKIAQRKLSMQKALPDVLDLLTVSVEAGLGFDGALAKLSEKMQGALVDEFNQVLHEIRMGVPRREALQAMGTRCGIDDISLFTTSLVQADQLGVSIGNVLRVQSADMRSKRRQRAEEKAQKAPVKMLFPLVIFIFPTIFIVLLGPAIIQMVTIFSQR